MGVGGFFKRLFAERPVQVDYSAVDDDRLLELWKERSTLTAEALPLLQAEVTRRGLVLPTQEPAKKPAVEFIPGEPLPGAPPSARSPVVVSNPVHLVPPCGVVLRTGETRGVLCLFPLREADVRWTRDFALGIEIEALVVCNDGEGPLPSAWMADRLGLEPESVFLLHPERPGDRPLPGLDGGELRWTPLPRKLERGALFLTASRRHPNALAASWTSSPGAPLRRAAVGPRVPVDEVEAQGATFVIGGLAVPEQPEVRMLETLSRLSQVVMMLDLEGVVPWAEPLAQLGVDVATLHWTDGQQTPGAPERIGAALPHLADAARDRARDFVKEGRIEEAISLLRRGLEWDASRTDSRLDLGTLLSERGRDDEAVALYSEGLEWTRVAGEAAALRFNRALCHLRQQSLALAREDLRSCLELLPTWPEPKAQLASVLIEEGARTEAQALLEELRSARATPELIAKIEARLAQ